MMKFEIFHQLKAGRQQLICFPYLGGYSNSYLDLAHSMKEDIEVWSLNLPGHGGSSESPLQTMEGVVELCYTELGSIIRPGCIFFGHSMGGIIAYFLTQRILEEKSMAPAALVLSACGAPLDFNKKNYSSLSDQDLLNYLASFGAVAGEIIKEKTLLEFFIPIFRSDFKILESASTYDIKPVHIPVYFLWGENDEIVPIDSVVKWSSYFSNEIHLIPMKNASHMFVHTQLNAVAEKLANILAC